MLSLVPWVTVPWLAALQGGTKDNRPLAQFALGSFESEQAFSEITLKVYNLLQAAQQAAELKRLAELSRLAEQERLEQARLQREAEARRLAQEEAEREAAEQLKQTQVAAKKAEQERLAQEQTELNRLERDRQKAEKGESSSGKKSTWLWGGIGASALLGAVVWVMQSKSTEIPPVQPSTTASSAPAIETTPTPEKVAEPDKPTIPLPDMITIQGGSFEMGCSNSKDCSDDEKPVRTVQVAAFEMSKTEVTFAQWDACVADGGCGGYKPDDEQWGHNNRPVINVSWNDAQNYVQWLSKKTKLKYRLPTEAEWEYAARTGTSTSYLWGDTARHEYANYGKDECCEGLAQGKDEWVYTAPVGRFAANAWGLYDMSGNVWEWVQDCYHNSYKGAPKSSSAWEEQSCEGRALRGGSWNSLPQSLRSANRFGFNPTVRNYDLGFRISRTF